MDFTELEASEGLRWPWHSWPSTRSAAAELVVPLSVLAKPLSPSLSEIPLLNYPPLHCSSCGGVLNPYARVDQRSARWFCPFCKGTKNPFLRNPSGTDGLPAELFPTHASVEYILGLDGAPPRMGTVSETAMAPAIVFVVDVCTAVQEDEMRALKNELLHAVAQLPENVLVGLVSFGAMVWVHDLGFSECSRMVVLPGDRELSSQKIQELLGIPKIWPSKMGTYQSLQSQGFLLPISECEFNMTFMIEELYDSSNAFPGHRPKRATGAAIAAAIALLEGFSSYSGGRVMIFTSGPATVGPGMIAETDLSKAIRTHRDITSGQTLFTDKAQSFYKKMAHILGERSIVLDLFACSLDQVGASEMRFPIETSGGYLVLTESFESEQFRKSLRHIFKHDCTDHLNMNFDATIEIITTKEVQICGALGPCISLPKKSSLVSEKEIGQGGTCLWKLNSLTENTSIAFIFQVSSNQNDEAAPVLFIQLITRYRHGNGGRHVRVTTAARRWVASRSPEISAGFDQEAASVVMARLAIHRAETYHVREVVRWLDKMLIRFTAKFGDYVPEDPSTFRLSSSFSLYPQFMYYLRRSQFIDVSNTTPDETAFFRLMLNREGVVGSLIMIQPTLFRYSYEGPPVPVLLDISSVSADVILLFDSYFHVVIHYGSNIAHWRKLGYHKDPSHENFKKLLEAPEIDAEVLIAERIPVPKLIKCDQHGSQARFLLARLNPSVTQKTQTVDGSEIIFTDDVSLQVFIEHLQELAVQD